MSDKLHAFPYVKHNGWEEVKYGMTLRDYFAAKAMQSLIAKFPINDKEGKYGTKSTQEEIDHVYLRISKSAYGYADAMLAQRGTGK